MNKPRMLRWRLDDVLTDECCQVTPNLCPCCRRVLLARHTIEQFVSIFPHCLTGAKSLMPNCLLCDSSTLPPFSG